MFLNLNTNINYNILYKKLVNISYEFVALAATGHTVQLNQFLNFTNNKTKLPFISTCFGLFVYINVFLPA